jgi:hypothetical protein
MNEDIKYALKLALATFELLLRLNPDMEGLDAVNVARYAVAQTLYEHGVITLEDTDQDIIDWALAELTRITEEGSDSSPDLNLEPGLAYSRLAR